MILVVALSIILPGNYQETSMVPGLVLVDLGQEFELVFFIHLIIYYYIIICEVR